jgi:hypothetical protein
MGMATVSPCASFFSDVAIKVTGSDDWINAE